MKDRSGNMEKVCTNCGKTFCTPCGEWAYKKYKGRGIIYFCSWKCVRAWEREHERSKIERRERIIQALTDGLSVKETAALLGEDLSKVSYWKQRMVRENV